MVNFNMNEKENMSEWENWKDAWGPIGVWFGDFSRGIWLVFFISALFSLIDWVSVYEAIYGPFSYDSLPYFSKIDRIQKYEYIYEKKAIAFSAVIAPIYMYLWYPLFVLVAAYVALTRNLRSPEITYTTKRNLLSIVMVFTWTGFVYFVIPSGFYGPSRFFGEAEFLKNNFFLYVSMHLSIDYFVSVFGGFWVTWYCVNGIKLFVQKIT